MPQVSSPACPHVLHQVLHEHSITGLFLLCSPNLFPDTRDVLIGGYSTDHTEVEEFKWGQGGLWCNHPRIPTGCCCGNDSLGCGCNCSRHNSGDVHVKRRRRWWRRWGRWCWRCWRCWRLGRCPQADAGASVARATATYSSPNAAGSWGRCGCSARRSTL